MSVWQLLSELGFPADRAHHQNIYLQGTLRLDVLYFLFQWFVIPNLHHNQFIVFQYRVHSVSAPIHSC
jgi:hypothetical protein